MKRYLVGINIVTNGRKIDAIKELRSALGIGLVEGKRLVETPLKGFVDSTGGNIIVNAQQLANLLILMRRETPFSNAWGAVNPPTFSFDNVEELVDNTVDVSSLLPLEA